MILPSLPPDALPDLTEEGIRWYRVPPLAAKRILEASLPRILPGLFLVVDERGDSTIWAEGEPPEAIVLRTEENARLFDVIAALVPDCSDDAAEED